MSRPLTGRLFMAGSIAAVTGALLVGVPPRPLAALPSAGPAQSIKHVVVIMEENHSFDNVLGKFCDEVARSAIVRPGTNSGCDGATSGLDCQGQTLKLVSAPDIVPASGHDVTTQQTDINCGTAGSTMDGFNVNAPCKNHPNDCYNQYDPLRGPCTAGSCIPNMATLATDYALSDRTFELYQSPSWEGHMYLVAATQDGFTGFNPKDYPNGPAPVAYGPGWGCDSGATTQWGPLSNETLIPSCVPDATGSLGPNWVGYTGSKAAYVPTIFDRLDAAGLSWRIYAGNGKPNPNTHNFQPSGWQWSICPSFAECLYTTQSKNVLPAARIVSNAAKGNLPALSIVTPTTFDSQHNGYSMSQGDDYIGQIVNAIQSGPDWSSTAIFITYDDCGCFYDHVYPGTYNSTWGVRVPMVIVSPYAKAGFTDSSPTTFAGILRFVEVTFGVQALNSADRNAYDYESSFCFDPGVSGCVPAGLTPARIVDQTVSPPTPQQIAVEQANADEDT